MQKQLTVKMLRSSSRDYSDAYIIVGGTITITGAGNDDAARRLDKRNKEVKFKNCHHSLTA